MGLSVLLVLNFNCFFVDVVVIDVFLIASTFLRLTAIVFKELRKVGKRGKSKLR